MKILGISGSPRKQGNTEFAVRRALEILQKEGADTKFIPLAGKEIRRGLGSQIFLGPALAIVPNELLSLGHGAGKLVPQEESDEEPLGLLFPNVHRGGQRGPAL